MFCGKKRWFYTFYHKTILFWRCLTKALPILIEKLALQGVISYLMPLIPKTTCQLIRQWQWLYCCSQREPSLLKDVKKLYTGIYYEQINKGHGRIESVASVFVKKLDSTSYFWPGLKLWFEFNHNVRLSGTIISKSKTRHVITSLHWVQPRRNLVLASEIIWGVETKFIMLETLPRRCIENSYYSTSYFFAIARNFALNLYRDQMFENI